MFDWDENFELDLVGNRQLDLLVYSWDPQYRHKLCYKGSVYLATLLKESPLHQLAVKVEPRGTIYLRLRYTDANQTFRRRGLPIISMATRIAPLFGIELETVVSFFPLCSIEIYFTQITSKNDTVYQYFTVNREAKTGGVPGGVSTALAMGGGVPNVPIIVWRCVEEVERRGLDIIGNHCRSHKIFLLTRKCCESFCTYTSLALHKKKNIIYNSRIIHFERCVNVNTHSIF